MLSLKKEEDDDKNIFQKVKGFGEEVIGDIKNYFDTYKDFFEFVRKMGYNISPSIIGNIIQAFITGNFIGLLQNKDIQDLGKKFITEFIKQTPCELHAFNLTKGDDLIKPCFMKYKAYQYLGPGTKVALRIGLGQNGINRLDRLAKAHDIVYYNTKDLDKEDKNRFIELRRGADEKLQEGAYQILLSKTDMNEWFFSLLTYIGMTIKINNNIY